MKGRPPCLPVHPVILLPRMSKINRKSLYISIYMPIPPFPPSLPPFPAPSSSPYGPFLPCPEKQGQKKAIPHRSSPHLFYSTVIILRYLPILHGRVLLAAMLFCSHEIIKSEVSLARWIKSRRLSIGILSLPLYRAFLRWKGSNVRIEIGVVIRG